MLLADPRPRWGVVADDLTGAADAGVQFARAGAPVSVHLSREAARPGCPAGLVNVVVTEARHLDDAAAETVTAEAVSWLVGAGADRVYVKIDSAGRGSIRAQVTGGLRAARARHRDARAVVCPAYPAFGRTVIGGVVHVDGVPTTSSPAAADPIAPPESADLRALWSADDVDVADASDAAQLADIATRVLRSPELLAVGSAGLLGHLVEDAATADGQRGEDAVGYGVTGAIVIVSGSLHPTARRQIDAVIEAELPDVTIVTAPVERVTPAEAAAVLAERAVAAVAAAHVDGNLGALVLVGGDGALATLRRLAAHRIDLDGTLGEGIPTGTVVGGDVDGIRIATKSGGFGLTARLVDLVDTLRRPAPTELPLPIPMKEPK